MLVGLTACGGLFDGPLLGGDNRTYVYSVGGKVTGLTGSGLALQNNGGEIQNVSAEFPGFSFSVFVGGAYAIAVKTQPSSPAQRCVVTNGSGTATSDVTNIAVACTNAYTVGGTVSGLVGSGLVLSNGGVDSNTLNVASNGQFSMPGTYASGEAYGVAVYAQPDDQARHCTVTNGTGSGTVANANIASVAVVCAAVGRFAYVANEGDNTISAYTINPVTGALASVAGSPFPTQRAHALAVDPGGRFLYTANFDSTGVSAYTIDTTTGALTEVPGSPFAAGASPLSVAVDPSGRFVYVANVNSANVSAFSIDNATGALIAVAGSPFAAGNFPFSVTADTSGHFLYVANGGTNNVSAYTIDTTNGALTTVAGSPFAAGTGSGYIAVDALGKFAYAANSISNDVSAYSVNAITGALSGVAGSPFAAGSDPVSVTSDPSGTFLFVANFNGGGTAGGSNVSAYSINPQTGALTAVAGSPFATGMNPSSVRTDPGGKFLYVANENPIENTVSVFSIDVGTGALMAVNGSPFPAGHNPMSIVIAK
jgi:6-phosphogluconolactonase